jgi:hypothetical protein
MLHCKVSNHRAVEARHLIMGRWCNINHLISILACCCATATEYDYSVPAPANRLGGNTTKP